LVILKFRKVKSANVEKISLDLDVAKFHKKTPALRNGA